MVAAKQLKSLVELFRHVLENYLGFTGLGLVGNSRGTAGIIFLLGLVLEFASLHNILLLSQRHGSIV